MTAKKYIQPIRTNVFPAILNSYSAIFFSKNRVLGLAIMAVTFFNFYAGLSGLIAVLTALLFANTLGFDKIQLKNGLFSFNALLTGIGMGTFFDPGYVYFSLLILAALMSLILSVTLSGWLGKYGLPVLSIPFVVSFWFIQLPAPQFGNLGLTQSNIFWLNEMYAIGGNQLIGLFQTIESLPIHKMLDIYLRALSSIFFQSNLFAGLIIAIALLISSRIAFSLSVVGFLSAYLFAQYTGSETANITYYNIGANYIMVAIAIGGFFVIPSQFSYLWAVMLVPLSSLVLLFLTKLFGFIQLPVFSLPFSLVVILFIYFLGQRIRSSGLILTPIQYYSPEINLYTYRNNKTRLSNQLFFPLHLPFWGGWTVSQGHDGKHTHIGDWGKAFDFVILDDDLKPFKSRGLLCEDYYCYNKPILAPADGIVEEVTDNFDDNEIGMIDTQNNWGNTIIIRHLPGLYTQMSHIRKGSFKVAKGDFVKRGDLLALCGNSGRSPLPHLHFQVQTTPVLGARTLDYPFAYYYQKEKTGQELQQFSKPAEGTLVSGIESDPLLKSVFNLLPESRLKFKYANDKGIETVEQWEAFTDAYNNKYLYCAQTESSAFYVNDGTMFYFTSFYGDKKSLLFYFYLSAYKIFLAKNESIELSDAMPLYIIQNKKPVTWLHDFIAPFINFIFVEYSVLADNVDSPFHNGILELKSNIRIRVLKTTNYKSKSVIKLKENRIDSFTYESGKTKIEATCVNSF